MWQLRKKRLRLTERLHFGELNQLNGCGRAEREAGCVHRAEELSGKRLSFSCQGWIFYLSFRFIGAALTHRSLFLIFQSRFSLLSVLLSLASPLFLLRSFFFPFGQITFSSSAPTSTYSFFFPQTLDGRQTDGHSASQSEMRQSWTWFRGHFQMPRCKGGSHFLSLLAEF